MSMRGDVILAVVAVALGGGCKKAREWAEKRSVERKAERERVEAVHAAEPLPARVLPDGPGVSSGTYHVVELRIEALPTDTRGKAWDPAGPEQDPDLEVTVSVGKKRESCRLPNNRLEGRCQLDLEIAIDWSTRIDMDVIDRDDLVDDPVGTAALESPSRWGTEMDLPMMPSGRLRSATIVLKRGPSWWDLYGARVIGLCAGSVLALIAIGSFRKTFLPPPPPSPPAPRIPACSHCGAVLAASATMCTNCGAVQKGSVS
jgi:hypothetical protein